ncbi:SANT/Myb_domain [Hexamita inflata]|uniref:SANT/Myb domain n=1 Tax=Hexamita inflata TaxID=28002 RepID=A0AA86PPA0_9EUKA|nr:SANT/Myb domain [Hexamita inflata]
MTNPRRWSEADKDQFAYLFHIYQKDFEYIAQRMGKTYTQVRSHYYNINSKAKTSRQTSTELSHRNDIHLIVFDFDFE